jgi:hypothetical protein
MNFRPAAVSLILFLTMAEEATGEKKRVWFRVLDNCRLAGSTTNVLAALSKDEHKRGLTNCASEEKIFPRGISLYRNCDELEGYELFGSSENYCRWLANPRGKKGSKSARPK